MENRKKQQLKKALKPIIQECIEEVLKEGTLIRTIIQEATKAAASQQQVIVERHYTGGFSQNYPVNQPVPHYQPPMPQPSMTNQPAPSPHEHDATNGVNNDYQQRIAQMRAEKEQQARERAERLSQVAGLKPGTLGSVQPLMEGGTPLSEQSTGEAAGRADPLRGFAANDPGVNIDGISDLLKGMKF